MANRDDAVQDPPRPPDVRDMFACYALAGIMGTFDVRDAAAIAAQAFTIADAMMAERGK